MDHSDHPAPDRSRLAAPRLIPPGLMPPERFEWTRQPGTGPAIPALGSLPAAAVVELGCGAGHNLACLVARHGATGIGIDHDPARIRRARAAYGHLPGLSFVVADAHRYLTAAEPGSADLVLSIFGAFSFTDQRPLLDVTARVLSPGGRLAITLRADDDHDTVVILRRR